MSKSVLYSANTTAQTATSGTVIDFGNIVRKYGCNCKMSGGNAVVSGAGYYAVDINLSFVSTDSDTYTIQLYKDGTAVTGATAILYAGDTYEYTCTIPAIIRSCCNCESTLSAVITGGNVTINNASVRVIKL